MSQLRIFSGSKASNQNGTVDQGPVGNRQQDQKLEKKKKKKFGGRGMWTALPNKTQCMKIFVPYIDTPQSEEGPNS